MVMMMMMMMMMMMKMMMMIVLYILVDTTLPHLYYHDVIASYSWSIISLLYSAGGEHVKDTRPGRYDEDFHTWVMQVSSQRFDESNLNC
jgi:hypothetical protein